MSVLKSKRKESPLRVYETAITLRKDISIFLLNRFCNEDLYNEKVVTENGTEITTRERYPQFAVDFIRTTILQLLQKTVQYITMANAIYPTKLEDLTRREQLQNYVIELCYALQAEFNSAADMFPQQLNCLLPCADRVTELTAQVRKWKKANKKIREKLATGARSDCSTNFCNVNNNGNSNNNNASNSNGVSPDFINDPIKAIRSKDDLTKGERYPAR